MKFETSKASGTLYLVGDDGEDLASLSKERVFQANVEGLDPDLEYDMKRHMRNGDENCHYEMNE